MIECESCGPSATPAKPRSREELLRNLVVGDIFHARAPSGASLLCLITKVNQTAIEVRRITTQEKIEFDRTTGLELGDTKSVIDSVAPLPVDIYNVLVGLDRRYRLARDPGYAKLTDAENEAFEFLDSFHAEQPLPQL